MKKIAAICIAALGAALFVLGTAPSASAYPEVTCNVTVDHQVIEPGDTFTATGTAQVTDARIANDRAAAADITWTFSWNGITKHRTGSPVHASFTAPQVNHTRKITLTARANTPQGPCVHHIDITVVGSTVVSPPDDGLPNTGGPAFWILVAALLLLLGGGGVVIASRRRS